MEEVFKNLLSSAWVCEILHSSSNSIQEDGEVEGLGGGGEGQTRLANRTKASMGRPCAACSCPEKLAFVVIAFYDSSMHSSWKGYHHRQTNRGMQYDVQENHSVPDAGESNANEMQ